MNKQLTKLELLNIFSFSIIHVICYFLMIGISAYSTIIFNISSIEAITYTAIFKATVGFIVMAFFLTATYGLVIADDLNLAFGSSYKNVKPTDVRYILCLAHIIVTLICLAILVNKFSYMTNPEVPFFPAFLISGSVSVCLSMIRSFLKPINDKETEKTK